MDLEEEVIEGRKEGGRLFSDETRSKVTNVTAECCLRGMGTEKDRTDSRHQVCHTGGDGKSPRRPAREMTGADGPNRTI